MALAGEGAQFVFAWGAGEDGQLGLEEAPSGLDEWHISSPTAIPAFSGVPLRVDATGAAPPLVGGSRTSLAVAADGSLFTWGWNQKSSLGLGHQQGAKTPCHVKALEGVRISQACWGGWHGVAVTEDGEAYAWGGNENLQTGATDAASEYLPLPARILPELRVTQVSAGGMHSLALTDTGDVWGWGQPLTTWGASADTNVYARQRSPMRVEGAANVVRIAAGAFHNLALTASGHVLAWGNSDYGQLGLGSTTHVATPHVVDELSKAGVTALAAGGWHSAALTAGGVVYVWGRGEHGRLGLGDAWRDRLRPVELPLAARAAHVTLGGTHSCVLTEDGVLYSFGRVSFGRLGRGPSSGSANEPNPVELPLPPANCRWRVEAVSAGGRHTLALARAVPANVPAAAEGGVAVAGAPAPALSVLTSASPMRRVASGSSLAGSARASLSFSPPPSPQPDHAGGAR